MTTPRRWRPSAARARCRRRASPSSTTARPPSRSVPPGRSPRPRPLRRARRRQRPRPPRLSPPRLHRAPSRRRDRARRPRLPLRVPRRLSAHPRRDPPQTRRFPASRPSPSPDPPRDPNPREEDPGTSLRVCHPDGPADDPFRIGERAAAAALAWAASVRSCCPRHPPATGRMITFAPRARVRGRRRAQATQGLQG